MSGDLEVHFDVRVFDVTNDPRSVITRVDVYGGSEHLVGTVSLRDLTQKQLELIRQWMEDDTELVLVSAKGQVALQPMAAYGTNIDAIKGWGG